MRKIHLEISEDDMPISIVITQKRSEAPTTAAQRACREWVAANQPGANFGKSPPMLSGYNVEPGGWESSYQLELLDGGHIFMPYLKTPANPNLSAVLSDDDKTLLNRVIDDQLPFSLFVPDLIETAIKQDPLQNIQWSESCRHYRVVESATGNPVEPRPAGMDVYIANFDETGLNAHLSISGYEVDSTPNLIPTANLDTIEDAAKWCTGQDPFIEGQTRSFAWMDDFRSIADGANFAWFQVIDNFEPSELEWDDLADRDLRWGYLYPTLIDSAVVTRRQVESQTYQLWHLLWKRWVAQWRAVFPQMDRFVVYANGNPWLAEYRDGAVGREYQWTNDVFDGNSIAYYQNSFEATTYHETGGVHVKRQDAMDGQYRWRIGTHPTDVASPINANWYRGMSVWHGASLNQRQQWLERENTYQTAESFRGYLRYGWFLYGAREMRYFVASSVQRADFITTDAHWADMLAGPPALPPATTRHTEQDFWDKVLEVNAEMWADPIKNYLINGSVVPGLGWPRNVFKLTDPGPLNTEFGTEVFSPILEVDVNLAYGSWANDGRDVLQAHAIARQIGSNYLVYVWGPLHGSAGISVVVTVAPGVILAATATESGSFHTVSA